MATKKRSSFRSRGAAIGRSMARGLKGTLVAGGSGAATFFVHDQVNKNIQFMANKPWLTPVGLIALGHVLKQRPSMVTPGIAVCGAGGYALGNALQFMLKTDNAAKAAEAKGLLDQEQETGALLEAGVPEGMYDIPEETGALISSADTLGM